MNWETVKEVVPQLVIWAVVGLVALVLVYGAARLMEGEVSGVEGNNHAYQEHLTDQAAEEYSK